MSDRTPTQLKRTAGVPGAVLVGLGSILGTGIFVSVGFAVNATGPSIVAAVAIAAAVALCNGLSSAQLAAAHPVSGGTYEYGYRFLSPSLGFSAGWLFLLAKTASAATAALGFAGYLLGWLGVRGRWALPALACGAALVVTVVVLGGLRRSNAVNALLVTATLAALGLFAGLGLPRLTAPGNFLPHGAPGMLEAAALMFVAFTGYGRIATMGEEVRNPARNIPRAMVITLVLSAAIYLLVALALVPAGGGFGPAPLREAATRYGHHWLGRVVGVGAMLAMLGVPLNLVLGLSRVWLAMGRRGDMPRVLARVNARGTTPVPAVVLTGLTIAGLALWGDIKATWSFSAFTVLVYYAITNAAALRLPPEQRRYPGWLAWLGLAGCLFLAFWVQTRIWMLGLCLIGAGLVWHLIARRIAARKPQT